MLVVACVEVGNYLDRGAEYVAKLRRGVERHLSIPHVFTVLTDDPSRHAHEGQQFVKVKPCGWWSKLELFRPDAFQHGDKILYLDLDTIVVGPLYDLCSSNGIVHLADWGWRRNDYCSCVMTWRHGEHSDIWTKFSPAVPKKFRGDQDWMTSLGGWSALPKGMAVSYRYHSRKAPPEGAAIVCFHGQPKPHAAQGWPKGFWNAD